MALSCDRLKLNTDHCTVNYSPSRQNCQPAAFVLHAISDFTTESYISFTKEKFLRGKDYQTDFPKSVHYLIGSDGVSYQLVELHDRAWGVSELNNPSWPLLNQCSWSDHEDLFIHIGIIGTEKTITQRQLDAAAEIMCCVIVNEPSINIACNEFGVIVARDLNSELISLYSVPDSVLPKTQVCVQQGGTDPFFVDDLGTYGSRISNLESWRNIASDKLIDLEVCCCQNRDAIAELEESIADLQQKVAGINVDDLVQRMTALEEGNFAIQRRLTIIENCLDCANICTPETPASIRYRLDLSSPAKLVPGVLQHLNLPIKINDVNPPIVTIGPLWFAELTEEAQTLCTTFKVKGSARLSSAEWCAGRILELYAVINSENILLNTYTAEAGNQSAAVYGETIFTVPPDSTVYLALKTDEDTSPLEVIAASIEIYCLDGLLSPNCVECDTV